MIIYDFNPNNLPENYLKAIGLVIACSSQTEEIMGHFLGALLGMDSFETVALHTHMSMPLKNDIIRSILELNAPNASAVDDVDDILDRIGNAISRRNEVAHNKFAIHPDTGEIYSLRVKARGSLQSEMMPVTLKELLDTADEVYRSGLELQEYMMASGLAHKERQKPLSKPLTRKRKARQMRRDKYGQKY